MIQLFEGDCLEVLKTLEENSVDSIVTDPPYELGFMGKSWDNTGIANSKEMWREAMRVLKPGGHLLAFSGTRTYHRMAVAIEDAGFEVRDMIEWVYGSGFPKSLNIGKAVDKLRGNERKEIEGGQVASTLGSNTMDGGKANPEYKYTKGTSEWEGWGTALKPAHEPICMARKPLAEKTVAENVLKYGTGGINIDESRVETSKEDIDGAWRDPENHGVSFSLNTPDKKGTAVGISHLGRFPANLIHDNSEEVRECFPETNPSKKAARGGTNPNPMDWGNGRTDGDIEKGHDDNGGNASRFFKSIIYQAKASKSGRGEGNNHPTVKPTELMSYLIKMVTPKGGTVLDPFMGSGSTGVAAIENGYGFIGIDMTPEYVEIARARIENVL